MTAVQLLSVTIIIILIIIIDVAGIVDIEHYLSFFSKELLCIKFDVMFKMFYC